MKCLPDFRPFTNLKKITFINCDIDIIDEIGYTYDTTKHFDRLGKDAITFNGYVVNWSNGELKVEEKKSKVHVKYQDTKGNEIRISQYKEGKVGSDYDVTDRTVEFKSIRNGNIEYEYSYCKGNLKRKI